ncbi:MAPEG family protein [Pacificimonas flava]|uniref:MAPEG family protein n=1 Tax=Pacificimonas flava TaxID=1234595 RepID=M2TL88_9SPHN|nr:MAPEG family protein [Pacificimonas flava]EMD82421.1 hypothetical protein C725_2142 [Pacificimonas flava]MBB5281255.1 hypothetical protein [Pacificimonas flava]
MFPATLLTAGALGLVLLILSYRVVQMRVAGKISLGNGGDERMLARTRAHANFTEYAPMILVLMMLVEASYGGAAPWGLWLVGLLTVLGRLLHARGMALSAPNKPRVFGMVLTFGCILFLSGWAAGLALGFIF